MFAQLWQMSGMFVLVSNLYVGEMLSNLTRKTERGKKNRDGKQTVRVVGGILSILLLSFEK